MWAPHLIYWRRKWHPTPVLLPGKSHGRRNLVGYSPWGRKELDTTERLTFTSLFYLPNKKTDFNCCPTHYSVQSLISVRLFATAWTAACQASLSNTNSQNLLKLMSMESVLTSKHLILCRPLLLLPSIFPSIKVFSNESVLCIRLPTY